MCVEKCVSCLPGWQPGQATPGRLGSGPKCPQGGLARSWLRPASPGDSALEWKRQENYIAAQGFIGVQPRSEPGGHDGDIRPAPRHPVLQGKQCAPSFGKQF